jgi:N-acetylneuraminic acid mutarotase
MDLSRREILKYFGVSTILGLDNVVASDIFSAASSYSLSNAQSLPIPIQEIYPAVFDGEIYVGGGFVRSDKPIFFGLSPSKQVFIFSPNNKTWRRGIDLPEARHHLGMVSNAQYLYGIGGFNGTASNAWQAKSTVYRMTSQSKNWLAGPHLPVPLAESVYASNEGNIHVVGGRTLDISTRRNVDTNMHFMLINNEHWEKAAPATVARNSAACAVLDNKIFVIGGRTYGENAANKQFSEVYDAKSDRWERIKPLPIALAGLSAVTLNGKIVVSGGEAFGSDGNWKTGKAYKNIWSYDPITDQWREELTMPQARHGHGAVSLNDKVYIIGGGSSVGPQGTLSSLLILEDQTINK